MVRFLHPGAAMNIIATSLRLGVLWISALFAAGALHAGPAEDVQQADQLLRAGDLPASMTLLRRAADQGHPLAMANLGDLLRAAQYEAEAVELYRKSAALGEPAGEVGLGRAYADGAGVKQDAARALELYRKAEAKNYGPAFDLLGRAYRTGTLGLPKDLDLATAYEKKAAAASTATAAAK
jgi:TPR repeat protein